MNADFDTAKDKVYDNYSQQIKELMVRFRQEKGDRVCALCEDRDHCEFLFHDMKTLIGLLIKVGLAQSIARGDGEACLNCVEAPFYALDNLFQIVPSESGGLVNIDRSLKAFGARLAARFSRRWRKKCLPARAPQFVEETKKKWKDPGLRSLTI